jgi:hypothetical protein
MAPARGWQREFEFHPFGITLSFDQLDLLQLFDARLNLTSLVGLVPEPVDELLYPRHFLGLAGGRRMNLGITRGPELAKFGVVAAKLLDRFVAKLPHMGDDAIEKRGVVADDQQR